MRAPQLVQAAALGEVLERFGKDTARLSSAATNANWTDYTKGAQYTSAATMLSKSNS